MRDESPRWLDRGLSKLGCYVRDRRRSMGSLWHKPEQTSTTAEKFLRCVGIGRRNPGVRRRTVARTPIGEYAIHVD